MLKSSVVVDLFMYTQAIILAHNTIIKSNVNFIYNVLHILSAIASN